MTMRYVIIILVLVTTFNGNAVSSDIHLPAHLDLPPDLFFPEIPHLDPIEFDLVELSYPGEMFSASVNISKGSMSGLSTFRLLELEFSESEPAITFHIAFPVIKLFAEYYELEGHISYVIPIKGQGIAHLEVQNLQLKGTAYMKKSDNSNTVEIEKFEDTELSLECIVSHTEFDHNIDNLISKIVEDLLAGYINRFSKYILITNSETIVQYINEVITKLEIKYFTNQN